MSRVSSWVVVLTLLAATTLPTLARPVSETAAPSASLRSLLASLLRQTLHRRLEGLMVEPGQTNSDATSAVIGVDVFNLDEEETEELQEMPRQSAHNDNIAKLPGSWLREPPHPVALSVSDATAPGAASDAVSDAADSTAAADNFRTEDYRITDLFTDPPPTS